MRALRLTLPLVVLASCQTAPSPKPPAALDAEPAAAAAPPTPPALRLPRDVLPLRYRLDLTVVPESSSLTGAVRIEAKVERPTQVVWLNATGLTVQQAALGGRPARVIPGGADFVGLWAPAPLSPGPLEISLSYSAPIEHQKSSGVFASKEGDQTYAYTNFEPIDARRAFPCFDEPAFKVPWQLTLHVKKEHVALGNTRVVSESDEPGGMKRVELAESWPLPSYLVAFVVGPFDVVDGGPAGRRSTPVRFVVPRGRARELTFAKEATPRVLAALESWFDQDYPFDKLDVAVWPSGYSAMEHPGLLAMGQTLTLVRDDQLTRDRRQMYVGILAHELAHYWFGDLVTCAWWDDLWLNEALAQWMDLHITDQVQPDWQVMDQRVGMAVAAMSTDELLSTQAIRLPVESNEAIAASFDGDITYLKGASVVRMFESFAGKERWREQLLRYLSTHARGTATADDLLEQLRAHLGPEVESGLRSFVEQPGVPLVSGKLSCAGTPSLELSQRRSLPHGVVDPSPKTWRVPVCVRYGDAQQSHQACLLLLGPKGTLPLESRTCPTWVLLNDAATGYYRSDVDERTARELLTPGSPLARAAKPTTAERLMLLADLRAAVVRGERELDEVLRLSSRLVNDPDDRLAASAAMATWVRDDVLPDELFRRNRRFQQRTFGGLARKLGWERATTDSDDRHRLRLIALEAAMLAGDDRALLEEGARRADVWLANPAGARLSDDLVEPALVAGARVGTEARFERYLAAARAAKDRTNRARLLRVLGAFQEPTLVQRALELVGSTEFDLRDSGELVAYQFSERKTRELAWPWLQSHLDELLARMRPDEAAYFLGRAAGSFCDQQHRDAAQALLTPRAASYDGARAAIARGLEQADRCIAAQARNLPAVRRFLAAYPP